MAFLEARKSILALLALLAIASVAQAQTAAAKRVFTNPLIGFSYASKKDQLTPLLGKIQYDLLRFDPAAVNFTIPITPAAVPTNVIFDALSAVKSYFEVIVTSSEVAFYNATTMFSQVSQYHLALYQNFTTNYDSVINILNGLHNTLANDEGAAVNDLTVIGDNVQTYINNFNASLIAALDVDAKINGTVQKTFANDTTVLITNMTGTLKSYTDMYNAARISNKAAKDGLLKNVTDLFSTGMNSINATRNGFDGLVKNFTSKGSAEIAKFYATFNTTCLPNEGMMNEVKNKLDEFNAYLTAVKVANTNWTRTLYDQAKDNLDRDSIKMKNDLNGMFTEFDMIFKGQGSDIQAWFNKLSANRNHIQTILNNLRLFADAEAAFVSSRNADMHAKPSLADGNAHWASLVGIMGNMSMIVNGPNTTGIANLRLMNNTFTVLRTQPPLKYDLTFHDPLPNLPANPVTGGVFTDTSLFSAFNAFPLQAGSLSHSATGSSMVCPNPYTASSAFPALYTAYPCYDNAQLADKANPSTPTVGGHWIVFNFDLSTYSFNIPPVALITLNADRIPDAKDPLSTPLSFSANIPNPTQVTSATSSVSTPPPAAAAVTYANNGWNNFVFSYRLRSSINALEVHLMVSDIDAARNAGLRATVSFLAP